jgi:hypothetical protein
MDYAKIPLTLSREMAIMDFDDFSAGGAGARVDHERREERGAVHPARPQKGDRYMAQHAIRCPGRQKLPGPNEA